MISALLWQFGVNGYRKIHWVGVPAADSPYIDDFFNQLFQHTVFGFRRVQFGVNCRYLFDFRRWIGGFTLLLLQYVDLRFNVCNAFDVVLFFLGGDLQAFPKCCR